MNQYEQILLRYWGYPKFRLLQEDIIRSVMEGHDTLALMPTGGGKSITFQVPSMAQAGICIVVTPLIALMLDQVENLSKKNIKAIAIHSGLTTREIEIALNNAIYGSVKFLYVSPERLGTPLFQNKIRQMNVNLLAIDESHCISQWGYDFRPSYLRIAEIRKLIPEIPCLALTATATPEIIDDIQEKLNFKEKKVLQKSFERKNITYLVRDIEDKQSYLIKTILKVQGSGIIYVRNRKKTREIASFLRSNKISADYYHAGLKPTVRNKKQAEWTSGKTRVIVATNAFGMGIDKPDVRFVIHIDLPDNIEAYFQEAGRAGRDEKNAYAVLLYNNSDKVKAEKRIETNFPDLEAIKQIYQALGNYFQIPVGGGKFMSFDFDIGKFAGNYHFEILKIHSSLKILEREGYLEYTDELHSNSKVHFIANRDDLYKFQVANASFDSFIKLLLRSYTGLFSDYIQIDENFLANKAKVSIDSVYTYLNKLNSLNIINYIPKKSNPMIVYTEERLDNKSLYISPDNLKTRKERYLNRIHAILNYASLNNKCRSQVLLSYFGQKKANRCGQCDVCTKRNELDLSKYEFDIILEKIKEILSVKKINTDQLIDTLTFKTEKSIKVIQWLLDNEKIIKGDDLTLRWKSK